MSVRRRPRLPVASDDTPSLLDQWNQCGAIDRLVEEASDPFSRAVLSNLRAFMPGILKSVSRQMIRLAT